MDGILEIILKDTFTQNLLKHRVLIAKSYLLKAVFGNVHSMELDQKDMDWLNSLPDSFYKKFNKDNIYQIFEDLEKRIDLLPTIIIYIPIESTDEVSSKICSFVRKTYQNPLIILNIKYNPTLIAGCAISWKGIYRDYSLKSKIEERKNEVYESFRKFLR